MMYKEQELSDIGNLDGILSVPDGPAPDDGPANRFDVVIVGGGYSGAVLLLQLLPKLSGKEQIAVIEPRHELGRGLAYSTTDPAHRINTFASRMTVDPHDRRHFDRWVRDTDAVAGDALAALPDGSVVPRREVFGRYVAEQVRTAVAQSKVRVEHVRATATEIRFEAGKWHIGTDDGQAVQASIAVFAASHQQPIVPGPLEPIGDDPRVIADPWRIDAVAGIAPDDEVVIIGTGLTMADIVSSLDRRGHRGPIHAISRRGLLSRSQSDSEEIHFGEFTVNPSRSASALLRRVRTAVRAAEDVGMNWHAVFHALSRDLTAVWAGLGYEERSRLLRHVRPYWDVHRFRIPPQTAAAIARRLDSGGLRVRAATLCGSAAPDRITLTVRPRYRTDLVTIRCDSVVVATGVGQGHAFETNALLGQLHALGLARPDGLGLGIEVDETSQALGMNGPADSRLYVAGPLARGFFGELMGASQILSQVAAVAASVAADVSTLGPQRIT